MAQTDNTSISMMWSTQNSHTVRGKVNKYNYLNKRLGSFLKLNNAFPIPNHFPPTQKFLLLGTKRLALKCSKSCYL